MGRKWEEDVPREGGNGNKSSLGSLKLFPVEVSQAVLIVLLSCFEWDRDQGLASANEGWSERGGDKFFKRTTSSSTKQNPIQASPTPRFDALTRTLYKSPSDN